MKRILYFVCMVWAMAMTGYTQSPLWQGLPSIQTYAPEVYDAHYQNWDMVQSKEGILYIGNGNGVLEYDGVSWRLYPMPNESTVRVLEMDEDGRIYVGAQGEMGYMAKTAIGGLEYVSLVPQIDSAYRDFRDVFTILITDSHIYYGTEKYHFRWPKDKLAEAATELFLAHPNARTKAFLAGDDILFYQARLGLAQKNGDSLSLVPGGERLALEMVHELEMLSSEQSVLSTYFYGQYIYDGKGVEPQRNRLSTLLSERTHYASLGLLDGSYAHSVFKDPGIIISDSHHEPVYFLNKDRGLISESTYRMFEDREGALWLTQNNGLSKIELHQAIRSFSAGEASLGIVNDILRHQGSLIIAASGGVFRLDIGNAFDELATLTPLDDIPLENHALLSFGDQLLIANPAQGLYAWHEGQSSKIAQLKPISLHQSRQNPQKIFIGTQAGLSIIEWNGRNWSSLETLFETEAPIHGIVEGENGELWLKTFTTELIRVWWENESFHHKSFKGAKGLAEELVYPFWIDGEIVFELDDQVFQYNSALDTFLVYKAFSQKFGEAEGRVLPNTSENEFGQLWVKVKDEHGYKQRALAQRRADGTYSWRRIYDEGIERNVGLALYAEGNEMAWMGGAGGLIGIDLQQNWNFPEKTFALVRKVQWGNDSTLYLGGSDAVATPKLPYSKKTLRFEFAYPNFAKEEKHQFQYKLVGFDKEWSEWTSATYKEYTNLPEGDYVFQLRAKNVYQHLSEIGSYVFHIAPPWYRSLWAYVLYLLFLGLIIWRLIKWRVESIEKEKLVLEQEVAKRTEELQLQTEKLQALDSFKSRFFANISHEFRTPLSLIKGPLNDLRQEKMHEPDPSRQRLLGLMDQQADRLLRLVNQLLALSKIESGELRLVLDAGDIFGFLRSHGAAFLSLAEQKGIAFNMDVPSEHQGAKFDQEKLAQIITNLLANAFKFTEEGGKVDFWASLESKSSSLAVLHLRISDTGIGISDKHLPYIFDRFFQVDELDIPSSEGTGIGLSLVKELLGLMGGEIRVESQWGDGSSFYVTIPLELKDTIEDPFELEAPIISPKTTLISTEKLPPIDNKALVLLVEDQPDLRMYVRDILAKEFEIIEAENGKIAWDMALAHIPDMVISDWMMPEMDGMQLCKLLKEDVRTSHIPVLMLTAKAEFENKLEGLKVGADDYLTKPFRKEELKVRTHNLISLRKQLQATYSQQLLLEPQKIVIQNGDEIFLNKAMEAIENAIEEADFGVPELRDALGMSRMQLQRKLKALTAMSPGEFIRFIRLKRAAQLLSSSQEPVSQIAYQVGFNNLSYFAKCFKEQFGTAPSDYQKSHK